MPTKPSSLYDFFDRCPADIPVAPRGADLEAMARLAEQREAEYESRVLGELRPAGRPNKVSPKRATEVRGVRLEQGLWTAVSQEAENIGCSSNRYIEEAVLARLGLLEDHQALEGWSAMIYSSISKMASSRVITFEPKNIAA